MNVRPVLGDWEIPRIESIESLEQRAFVELPVPGRVGSLFQDMNAEPMRIAVSGSLYGDEARDRFLEELRSKFQAGEPVTFVGDVVTATEVQYVIIETLELRESGLCPDQTQYAMVLRESPPPPPTADPLGGLDSGLLEDAGGFLDSMTGALDAVDGIPDLSDPTAPLSDTLNGVSETLSGLSAITGDLDSLFGEGE
jgi:hypothetical protein